MPRGTQARRRRIVPRLLGIALGAAALFGWLGTARAESNADSRTEGVDKPLRVVVDRFAGDRTSLARAGVMAALDAEDSVDVVSIKVLDNARKALDGSPQGYQAAARRLDLSFIVRGKLKHADRQYRITVMIYGGSSGRAQWFLHFSADTIQGLRAELKAHFWERFEQARARGGEQQPGESSAESESPPAPPSKAKPASKAKPSSEAPSEAEAPPAQETSAAPSEPAELTAPAAPPSAAPSTEAGRVCPWLVARVSGGALYRMYDYTGEQRGALRGYRSTGIGAPRAAAGLSLFPFSQSSCNAASGLGLSLEYERLIGPKSRLAGRSLATDASAERAELEYRIEHDWWTLGLIGGYRGRHFDVAGGEVPNVAYLGAGGGLELGFRTQFVSAEIGGTALHLFDTGQVGSAAWFPRVTGLGIDARAELAVSPTWWFDIVLGGRWAGYFLQLNATDATAGTYPNGVARTAYDHYFMGELALRCSVPGRRH